MARSRRSPAFRSSFRDALSATREIIGGGGGQGDYGRHRAKTNDHRRHSNMRKNKAKKRRCRTLGIALRTLHFVLRLTKGRRKVRREKKCKCESWLAIQPWGILLDTTDLESVRCGRRALPSSSPSRQSWTALSAIQIHRVCRRRGDQRKGIVWIKIIQKGN